jgi:putative phage-type endonuclease
MDVLLNLELKLDNPQDECEDEIGVFENFTENEYIDLETTVHELMYDLFNDNSLCFSSENFYKNTILDITDYLYDLWSVANICNENDYEDIQEYIEQIFDSFFEIYGSEIPNRSVPNDTEVTINTEYISKHILYLKSIPQPEQRTEEWYKYRHNLLTASNIWKIFSSESQQNSFIVEKCKLYEITPEKTNWFSGGSLQWGVTYEPVSVQIYEKMFVTKVGDFGCIQHTKYPFIGASPDGINITPYSDRFGRMLEIKNIVNREITGIPKEEYWIQMQIQMETCDLDYCDFFETRFKEYENENDFFEDETHEWKGFILCFIERNSPNTKPTYKYSPIELSRKREDVHNWIENMKLELKENLILYTTNYWYLDEFSCVLVERNRIWFETALPKIEEFWNIIQKERVNGEWDNRISSKKRDNMEKIVIGSLSNLENEVIKSFSQIPKNVCLIKLE